MIKRTITYEDYNGVERTEDFYFHFSKAELMEMEMGESGGFSAMVRQIIASKDAPSIIKVFKKLVLDAYGEKSPDGKRFIKSEELKTAFSQTEAYSQLFMELATDDEKGAEFVNGVIPASLAKEINEQGGLKALSDVTK